VGLKPRAYDALRKQFEERTIRKFYWAVCAKAPKEPSGVIKLSIAERGGERAGRDVPKTAFVSSTGKPAVTAYRVLDQSELGALIEARPVTGRLHQVRVHLDAIGCTILGDDFYGPKSLRVASPRLALHAHRLIFKHPTTGQEMDIKTVWPADLRKLLHRLKLKRPDRAEETTDAGGNAKAE
jgi:23S rRNA-/tRNA-specific pseudouridylate synthase